jgi:hypothetical protein
VESAVDDGGVGGAKLMAVAAWRWGHRIGNTSMVSPTVWRWDGEPTALHGVVVSAVFVCNIKVFKSNANIKVEAQN